MSDAKSWPGGFPFRPIMEPRVVRSRSRRVVRRFLHGRELVRLANSILLALFSLYSGQHISLDFHSALKLFMDHSFKNSHINISFEARVHSFVLSCARRLFARGGQRHSLISDSDVENFLTEDVLKHLKVPGSYLSPVLSVPLVCDLVSLPNNLTSIRMLDHLPDEFVSYYNNPLLCLRSNPPPKLPRPFVGASPPEYLKLMRRLFSLGMVTFMPQVEVVNGLFAVPKDVNSQRLILDCRPTNALFQDVLPTVLPTPADLSNLLLPAGVPVYGSKTDLDNFYHRIIIPDWMVPYFGLPKVRAADIDPSIANQFGHDSFVFPAFLRLPMGFVSAVHISQTMHQHFLSKTIMRPYRFLTPGQKFVLKIGEVILIIYVDDLVALSTCQKLLDDLMTILMNQYTAAGFVVKLSKHIPATTVLLILGLEFDGLKHTLSVTPERAWSLRAHCLRLVHQHVASAKQLEVLLGHVIWAGLVRRPVLSVLNKVYHFLRADPDVKSIRPLWRSVKQELLLIAYLVPLMFADMSPPVFDKVMCTDASSTGGAVTVCDWPRSFFDPYHILIGYTKPFDIRELTSSIFPQVFGNSRWSTKFAFPWKWKAHINFLEMTMIEKGLQWFCQQPLAANSRFVIFSDSLVCVSALSKGRSSSPNLISPLRRISALVLCLGIRLLCPYVPSKLNPADEPSRYFK